jgi:hypothetical protein
MGGVKTGGVAVRVSSRSLTRALAGCQLRPPECRRHAPSVVLMAGVSQRIAWSPDLHEWFFSDLCPIATTAARRSLSEASGMGPAVAAATP